MALSDPATATQDDLLTALSDVYSAAVAQFETANPGRLSQLDSALATAEMAVSALFTEIPYHSS